MRRGFSCIFLEEGFVGLGRVFDFVVFAGPDLLALLEFEGVVHAHVDDFDDTSLAGAGDGERITLRETTVTDVVVDVGEVLLHALVEVTDDVVLVAFAQRAVLEVDDEVGLAVLFSRGDHGGKKVLGVLLTYKVQSSKYLEPNSLAAAVRANISACAVTSLRLST